MPQGAWAAEVREIAEEGWLSDIPFYDPAMESLTPEELARFRAKAFIWRRETGEWPEETAWIWELRMARRRGDLGHTTEVTEARIDSDGVLTCGFCHARGSADRQGHHAGRCKLCDRLWNVTEDKRGINGSRTGIDIPEHHEWRHTTVAMPELFEGTPYPGRSGAFPR